MLSKKGLRNGLKDDSCQLKRPGRFGDDGAKASTTSEPFL
jgi:hypothetical protein